MFTFIFEGFRSLGPFFPKQNICGSHVCPRAEHPFETLDDNPPILIILKFHIRLRSPQETILTKSMLPKFNIFYTPSENLV